VIGEAYDVTHLHFEDAATTMQDALLPSEVPVLPRAKVCATSLVADAAGGGDWFEALPVPDRSLALVVGDVPGQGMDASALMAPARAVMTERLRSGLGLSAALRSLDALSESVPELVGATLLVAVLDPVTRRLSYCTAGHPPPLVLPAAQQVLDRAGLPREQPDGGGSS
jgi:serine phosphatase RsbU (regulator of sigma subunit)